MEIIVFDLSTLTFRRSAGQVSLSLPGLRDAFALEPAPSASDREIVFELLDRALGELRVPVGPVWAAVGFYNPLTAQVAVGAVPRTETFAAGEPVELDLYGTLGRLEDGILHLGGQELLPVVPEAALVSRLLAAHTV